MTPQPPAPTGSRGTWAQEALARRSDWERAPSAHNTQPWVWRAQGEELLLGWDEARHLHVADPTRRDLMLSLGAAAETMAITAADSGYAVDVQWRVDLPARQAAVLRLTGGAPQTRWSVADLAARRTARAAYQGPWVSADQVAASAVQAELPDGAGLHVVDEEWVRRWLPIADRFALAGPGAAELLSWMRLSRRHPRYQQDGLSDQALGLSATTAAALRVVLTRPIRAGLQRTGAMRLVAATATARPLGTVVALTGPPGLGLEGLGDLGRALMRFWLAATAQHWSIHPLSALLDCPQSRAAWPSPSAGADQPVGGEPYAVLRIGIPTAPAPRSARLH